MSVKVRGILLVVAVSSSLLCAVEGGAGQADSASLRSHVNAYRVDNERQILAELGDLVALPNVAANLEDMERNATHLVQLMERRGFSTDLLRASAGPPVVFGELTADGAERTVIFYAHYDGQPVAPERWSSDPWRPILRSGRVEEGAEEIDLKTTAGPLNGEWRLYGRSASDDKVSIVALLSALDALEAAGIKPSVNIKLFLDGEEERGSPHVAEILGRFKDRLDADLWIFCDGPMHQTRRPQVVFGVRGVTSVEMTTYGPAVALHSGHYGNWAPDPGMLLARLLTSMRDERGDVAIAGIGDLVEPLSTTAKAALAAAPEVDGALRDALALGWTEGAPEPLAERIALPAINLLGFSVGNVGDGAKNAIAPSATAVVGCRLVPQVTPEAIRKAVEIHVREQGFFIVHESPTEAVRRAHAKVVWLRWKGGYPALWTDMELPVSMALAEVVEGAVGGPVVLTPSMGGSLPLNVFSEALGAPPIVVLPIANHDNNQHGANENLRLANLWQGIEIYAGVMARLGEVWGGGVAGR